jgi:hypothetical protein
MSYTEVGGCCLFLLPQMGTGAVGRPDQARKVRVGQEIGRVSCFTPGCLKRQEVASRFICYLTPTQGFWI